MLKIVSAVLVVCDVLAGLGVLAACGVLGVVLRSSHVRSDKNWGLGVWAFGLLYASHALGSAWLWMNGIHGWALGVSLVFIGLSVLGVRTLAGATEAAARP